MKRVAIIGAGIFGVSCALALPDEFEVSLFERHPQILSEATYGNQNRFHYGYHYPRSLATSKECLEAQADFADLFGDSIVSTLANFYCVAKSNSKISPAQYTKFCDSAGLSYEFDWPREDFLNRELIEICLRVPEPIFDFFGLRAIALEKISNKRNIMLRTSERVSHGGSANDTKFLAVEKNGTPTREAFDFVINATYSQFNRFLDWFGFARRLLQYELCEIPIIKLPNGTPRTGVTVMDGSFCSILPMGNSEDKYLLYHVEQSVLDRKIAYNYEIEPCVQSNWEKIRKESSEYIPIVKQSEFLSSIFAVRIVSPETEMDDARKTDIIYHGDGCWSVLSAKIVTAVTAAKKIATVLSQP